MLCMALLLPLLPRWELGEPLDAELVADHVRALRVGPIAEVISTDRHKVKPWLSARSRGRTARSVPTIPTRTRAASRSMRRPGRSAPRDSAAATTAPRPAAAVSIGRGDQWARAVAESGGDITGSAYDRPKATE